MTKRLKTIFIFFTLLMLTVTLSCSDLDYDQENCASLEIPEGYGLVRVTALNASRAISCYDSSLENLLNAGISVTFKSKASGQEAYFSISDNGQAVMVPEGTWDVEMSIYPEVIQKVNYDESVTLSGSAENVKVVSGESLNLVISLYPETSHTVYDWENDVEFKVTTGSCELDLYFDDGLSDLVDRTDTLSFEVMIKPLSYSGDSLAYDSGNSGEVFTYVPEDEETQAHLSLSAADLKAGYYLMTFSVTADSRKYSILLEDSLLQICAGAVTRRTVAPPDDGALTACGYIEAD